MNIHEIMQRSGGNVPRVHGNGFIQLDLDPGRRLHIWGHPDVRRQVVDTGIHDHRFAFVSRVLVGRVMNVEWGAVDYDFAPDNVSVTHKIYAPEVRDGEDTILRDTGHRVAAYPKFTRTVLVGQSYTMEPAEFHETVTDRPSATLMRKTFERPELTARVLVPVAQEPDNDFNRNSVMSTPRMWAIIEEVMSSC